MATTGKSGTPPSARIILGVDPGTTITGYGIIRCKGKYMELVNYGIIRLGKQQMDHPAKLKKIFERISGLVSEFDVQEMALEAPFHGKNVQSMLKLGRAQGVAMAAGLVYNLPIFEYAPRKIKMAVTGSGTASKDQVARMLEKVLEFSLGKDPLDATDGLAAAVCHFYQGVNISTKSGHKDWSSFLKNNPGRIKDR